MEPLAGLLVHRPYREHSGCSNRHLLRAALHAMTEGRLTWCVHHVDVSFSTAVDAVVGQIEGRDLGGFHVLELKLLEGHGSELGPPPARRHYHHDQERREHY